MCVEQSVGGSDSKLQHGAEAQATLSSLPLELLARVLGLHNPRNCLAAAQLNQALRHVALDAVVKWAADPDVLCAAAKAGSAAAVRALLEAGADFNVLNCDGWLPTGLAAAGGHVAVMRALVAAGADAMRSGTNSLCHDSLHLAVVHGHVDLVRFLLSNVCGIEQRFNDEMVAPLAAELHLLVNSTTLLLTLHLAAKSDSMEVAKMLLEEHGADPNVSNWTRTPLFCAAEAGYASTVALLLEKGAQVDKECNLVHEYGRLRTCPDGATPLVQAALNSHASVVDLLLKAGADPNRLFFGRPLLLTLVNSATLEGGSRHAISRLLLEGGADPDGAEKGTTPLHIAAYNNDARLVRLLLRHGANKDARNGKGCTPLMCAAKPASVHKLSLGCVRALLEAGSLVDAQSEDGAHTALHLAVMANVACTAKYGAVQALLAAGADRTLRNAAGHTALELAELVKCGEEVIALLRRPRAEGEASAAAAD